MPKLNRAPYGARLFFRFGRTLGEGINEVMGAERQLRDFGLGAEFLIA